MHFSTTLFATFLTIRPALGDFLIFCGVSNQSPDPTQVTIVEFFNNPPDCADAVSGAVQWTISPNNDATFSGIACDGCDGSKAPQDWDVTRFEVHDHNHNTFDNAGDEPHFTLYKDEANGGWGMYDTDMKSIGKCDKPDPVQIFTCPDVLSADNAAGIFHCTTDVTVMNSN